MFTHKNYVCVNFLYRQDLLIMKIKGSLRLLKLYGLFSHVTV